MGDAGVHRLFPHSLLDSWKQIVFHGYVNTVFQRVAGHFGLLFSDARIQDSINIHYTAHIKKIAAWS